jgi:multidrug efflux pump
MALTVATGFVVDDAIVVLENVTRHLEAGVPRFQAALLGAREVGFTVLSISVSLVAVFIPILMMGGIVGRLFREFAVSLSVAIIVSLLISLTTTPMMCAYLAGRPKRADESWVARLSEGIFGGMQRIYRRALTWALDAAPVMLAVLICTIALNVYLFTIVPKGFFPQQDTGQLMGGFRLDQSSSFQMSRERLISFVNIVRSDHAVESVVAFQGGRGGSAGGFLMVSLKPKSQRKSGGFAVVARLRPRLAQVTGASLFLNPVQDVRVGGRSSNATYQYTLQSDDLELLRTWATKLSEAMKRQPALTDVNTDQEDHGLETFVTIDRDKAASVGLTARDVDNTLYDGFGQRQVSTIYKDLNQYHVIMEVDPRFSNDPTALSNVYIARPRQTTTTGLNATTPAASLTSTTASSSAAASSAGLSGGSLQTSSTGSGTASVSTGSSTATSASAVAGFEPSAPPSRDQSSGSALSTSASPIVPLSTIAKWADAATPTRVNHQDLSVATTISFNLADNASLSDATAAIEQAQADISMPVTVHGSFQGTAKAFEDSLANEPVLIAAALLAVYIVLGILYESYIHPLTVLSTLPSAGVGAVLALLLFKTEFSIIALIGVVLLIGIVKKNAIMIIDFALEAERSRGLSTRDAVFEACMLRFRPIMMTTFAAMLGALPLAIGWGEGAELRRPLGITIIGGLLLSQLITLLTTPVVYLYLDRLRGKRDERHLGRLASAEPGAGPQPAPQGA